MLLSSVLIILKFLKRRDHRLWEDLFGAFGETSDTRNGVLVKMDAADAEMCVLINTHFLAHFVVAMYCYSNAATTGCSVAPMMSACRFQRRRHAAAAVAVFPSVERFCVYSIKCKGAHDRRPAPRYLSRKYSTAFRQYLSVGTPQRRHRPSRSSWLLR